MRMAREAAELKKRLDELDAAIKGKEVGTTVRDSRYSL